MLLPTSWVPVGSVPMINTQDAVAGTGPGEVDRRRSRGNDVAVAGRDPDRRSVEIKHVMQRRNWGQPTVPLGCRPKKLPARCCGCHRSVA